jgi:nucleoside 2-deoxyribosyltransferase
VNSLPKRFYLSTRKDRSAEGAALTEALEALGWQCTFDWTALQEANLARYPEIAQAEIAGVREADVLLVLLPGGYGTHAEIGAALALGRPIIIHAPNQQVLDTPYPCVFHHHPGVKILISEVLDVDAVLACMPSGA